MNIISKLIIASLVLTLSGCNENPGPSDSPDSLSVKRMSTDSNSEMPVQTPTDTTAKMPNAYDSTKK